MRKLLYGISATVACGLWASSCSDSCSDNQNALPLAGFYDSGGPAELVTIDSLEVIGVDTPSDSALSPASESKNQVSLPFRIDSDTTRYVFIDRHEGSGLRDTVTFIYTRTPHLVNKECGVSYIFDIRSITSQGIFIDSVTCPNGFINNANTQNLNIYFDVMSAPV